jgi:hypothetical protein
MPVAVNVMQKGSSVDNDDFGCGKVHLLCIYELTLLLSRVFKVAYSAITLFRTKNHRPLTYTIYIGGVRTS